MIQNAHDAAEQRRLGERPGKTAPRDLEAEEAVRRFFRPSEKPPK